MTDDDRRFHRWLTTAEARRQARGLTITADEGECSAIALRFDLIAVGQLHADLRFAFDGDVMTVSGNLQADIIQRCVATDQPLPAKVAVPIDVRYVPIEQLEAAEADAEIELGAEDLDIIGYHAGRFDLGDMLAETLYLALELYPRSPDADAWLAARGVQSEAEAGAFGALAGLRDQLARDAK